MTVRELIEQLRRLDQDYEAVIVNDDGDCLPIISVEQSQPMHNEPVQKQVGIFVS